MNTFHTAAATLVGSALLLSGCASTPAAPSADMTRAKAAIEQAERAGAREFANDSLTGSVQKMDMAQQAASRNDKAEAARLVDESYADAHLAQVTAEAAKAQRAAKDVDKGVEALRQEASRPATP
jgi:PBP1b-binding outer membrane lipoprotein LpoB